MNLNLEDKKFFIKIAKDALWSKLVNENFESYYKDKEIYRKKFGIFIKVFNQNILRGYGGILKSDEDIVNTIQKITEKVCFKDYRFMPISKEEYNDIKFKIIIIEEIVKVNSFDEINKDKDGIIIRNKIQESILFPFDIPDIYQEEFIKEALLKADVDTNNISEVEIFKIANTVIDEEKLYITPLSNTNNNSQNTENI